uniref:Secretogranin-1 n=1 Tax=Bos taurus TaxID=9913 RepID=SCG1_BOVIN|nr:RecName: Full=Secretogranin-1; AltName: Full=Chromogranin-B; Short=CgB; AltName: Full=Secretogranin I; Short=SgI; Contains: RecName: Full=PE-11; Contains: RecName: Full=Secretogranin-1(476-566); Contains: RecName: Full=Peptide BAM-1745; Contains: RecName: Full=Secretolytin; Contains: RecName: Full=CCB peptide; Flags: Precursor [Bos taurus]
MQPAALLGLLGATVVAAVSSMPVDIRNHNEEVVTHCIIEVLSNALLKSSAPPITPECRQVLKKNGKELKNEEKSENENTRFEVRLLRDPADTSEAPGLSSREDSGEGDAQVPTVADTESGGHSRERAGEPPGSQVAKEAKTRYSKSEGQNREEEMVKYQKRERGEVGSEERLSEGPGKAQTAFLNQRNQTPAKKEELVSRYDTQSARGLEKSHSRERSSQESGEETKSQENWPQELQRHPEGQEAPGESEEDASPEVDKRHSRPRHHHGRSRPDRSSQEGNPPLEEESHVGTGNSDEEKARHPAHFRALEEGAEYGEEVRRHSAAQAPGDLQGARFGGRGRGEHQALRRPSEESLEQENKRHGLSPDLNMAQGYSEESEEERGPAPGPSYRARGGEAAAYSTLGQTDEKRFLGETHHRVQESQRDKARRRLPGELRNYLDYGEEKGEEAARGKWQPQGDPRDADENREEARLRGKQYAPHHITEKRLGELLNPFYDPSQWKSSRFERKDPMDDSFLEGEEENGLTLNEKNFFPEYNYDWWEKKPFEEDVNWGYEKRNPVPKLDLKRQYDRVAELDQLLHYRKKSAEFPDFYDSEEQMSPQHTAENEEEKAGQGVLTEEEEKELENLAAMDLELQKIAEKFSGTRRG